MDKKKTLTEINTPKLRSLLIYERETTTTQFTTVCVDTYWYKAEGYYISWIQQQDIQKQGEVKTICDLQQENN